MVCCSLLSLHAPTQKVSTERFLVQSLAHPLARMFGTGLHEGCHGSCMLISRSEKNVGIIPNRAHSSNKSYATCRVDFKSGIFVESKSRILMAIPQPRNLQL